MLKLRCLHLLALIPGGFTPDYSSHQIITAPLLTVSQACFIGKDMLFEVHVTLIRFAGLTSQFIQATLETAQESVRRQWVSCSTGGRPESSGKSSTSSAFPRILTANEGDFGAPLISFTRRFSL